MSLVFDPIAHTYTLDGQRLVGVTSVLQDAGLIDTTYFTDEARERGTRVHIAVEAYLKYDDDAVTEEIQPYLDAFKKAQRELQFEVLESEIRLHSAAWRYAGTADCIAMMDGVLFLLDWKSGAAQKSTAIQTVAYAEAYWEEKKIPIIRRGGVHLQNDGLYKFKEYTDHQGDLNVFHSALTVANWKRNTK